MNRDLESWMKRPKQKGNGKVKEYLGDRSRHIAPLVLFCKYLLRRSSGVSLKKPIYLYLVIISCVMVGLNLFARESIGAGEGGGWSLHYRAQ